MWRPARRVFKVFVGNKLIDQWSADMVLPGDGASADSSVRRRITKVALHMGDVIRIEGIPDRIDRAALDYIELIRTVP
jgi:hypothetical protein